MVRRRCGEAGIDPINVHRFRHTGAHQMKMPQQSPRHRKGDQAAPLDLGARSCVDTVRRDPKACSGN
jgi:hypothetical protein